MKVFTFKKGLVGNGLFAQSSFKSFIVLLVMMIMTTSSAMAEVIDGFRYKLNSETKTAMLLPSTDGSYSGDIVVPEKIRGNDGVDYLIVAFEEKCFCECNGLTSVTIPSSVTSLGNYCFSGCSSLTSVTIPSSVMSLGNHCFSGCSRLISITIPSSVTSLASYCFNGCISLRTVIIPSSVTSLASYCFSGCSRLTSVTIPSSVTSLGHNCFENCYDLTTITIPSSVTTLGSDCFRNCSNLTSITIPSSITSFEEGCFENCSSLTSIIIPSSVTTLKNDCFYGCSSLANITIPSSVTTLGNNCFRDCQSLSSITIPSSVKVLGNYCLNCNIETLYFKGKLPDVYNLSFWGWPELTQNYNSLGIPKYCDIKVPTEYLQDYKDAFGEVYKYISAWNPDETGDGDKPATSCATPSVSYESGELKFACETAGAKYHYTINDKDMATDALSEDGKVSLSAAYNISVYATADGYSPSEKAEATLYWINANLETANINLAKTRGIVASAHDGIVSISGLDNGEVVKFYAADGKLLGSSSAVGGVASCAVSEKMVIAKIGMDTIKVLMK